MSDQASVGTEIGLHCLFLCLTFCSDPISTPPPPPRSAACASSASVTRTAARRRVVAATRARQVWPCPGCCLPMNPLFRSCRKAVSQNKVRYQAEGFDLDLAYVTPRIIVHGFPSTGFEHIWRNPRYEVRGDGDDGRARSRRARSGRLSATTPSSHRRRHRPARTTAALRAPALLRGEARRALPRLQLLLRGS